MDEDARFFSEANLPRFHRARIEWNRSSPNYWVRDQLPGVGVAVTFGVIAGTAGVAAGSCGAAMGEGEVAGMTAGDAAGEGVVFAVLVALGLLTWCRCVA